MESFEARTNQFVMAMVLACRGEPRAQQDVSILIGQMLQDPATVPMGESLMQIVVGERDRERLTAPLEGESRMLINRILDDLGA
ncbi:MAG TPA: hypothetical protein VH186_05795 [Chloroflexia bacterium]|nr:hypothetical protein [Chloroflexia bacterium]